MKEEGAVHCTLGAVNGVAVFVTEYRYARLMCASCLHYVLVTHIVLAHYEITLLRLIRSLLA